MYPGEFQRLEKSLNGDGTPQEWLVFRLLGLLYSRLSISAKTCRSATNAPSVPKTVFFEQTIRSISTTKNQQEAALACGGIFWNELASRNQPDRMLRSAGRRGVARVAGPERRTA